MSAAVVPIRPRVKLRKENRPEDVQTIMIAGLARSYAKSAYEAAQTVPDSKEHRHLLHMAGIDGKLPRANLVCIVSTLDERRDFDLRCVELEIAKIEHELATRRIDRLAIIEGVGWWESHALEPLVHENNERWERYRAVVLAFAGTPARTKQHLERKIRLIGGVWLKAEGEWYQRLRQGVAVDEAWLSENAPKPKKRELRLVS